MEDEKRSVHQAKRILHVAPHPDSERDQAEHAQYAHDIGRVGGALPDGGTGPGLHVPKFVTRHACVNDRVPPRRAGRGFGEYAIALVVVLRARCAAESDFQECTRKDAPIALTDPALFEIRLQAPGCAPVPVEGFDIVGDGSTGEVVFLINAPLWAGGYVAALVILRGCS